MEEVMDIAEEWKVNYEGQGVNFTQTRLKGRGATKHFLYFEIRLVYSKTQCLYKVIKLSPITMLRRIRKPVCNSSPLYQIVIHLCQRAGISNKSIAYRFYIIADAPLLKVYFFQIIYKDNLYSKRTWYNKELITWHITMEIYLKPH